MICEYNPTHSISYKEIRRYWCIRGIIYARDTGFGG